jgi:hypothetical protein
MIQVAANHFRVVNMADVRREDLLDPAISAAAFECSTAGPEEADAFLSHSWGDDSAASWQVLARWRQRFVEQRGREPLLWFDRCCVAQEEVAVKEALASLPIFIARCESFVLLYSRSYFQRLWCVMELFTFIYMGGEPEQIQVLLQEGSSEADFYTSLREFDIHHCDCYSPVDKDLFLGVIEASFYGLEGFNATVREIVDQLRVVHSHAEEGTSAQGGPSDQGAPHQGQGASVHVGVSADTAGPGTPEPEQV